MHIDTSMKAATVSQTSQQSEGTQSGANNNVAVVTTTTTAAAATTTAGVASPAVLGTPIRSRNQNRSEKQQQEDKSDNFPNVKGKTPPKPPDEFYRDLQQFHEKRGTPIRNTPRLTGNKVDLHRLYCEVTERGGFQKVNMRDEWDDVLPELGWKEKIVNGSAGLKYIYRRFLEKYERLNYFGEDPDKADAMDGSDIGEIMGVTSGRSNRGTSRYPSSMFGSSAVTAAAIHNVAMTYNYKQHHINMEKRRQFKLSTDLHKSSPYEKLMLSLLSPLPNEQDFAINACTLMANESKHTLKLNEYPKLMDALLAHTGVFSDYTMRKMFQHVYSGVRRHSLYGFWYDLLNDRPQILDLYTDEQAIREGRLIDDWDDGKNYVEEGIWSDSKELDFLNLGRAFGTQDHVGQRVLQVVSIVRNVSFFEENLQILVKNKTLLRFLVMSSNIRWNNVHIQALEITGNIAGELDLLDPTTDELSRCLMATICDGIEGPDRGVIINCLEILYKLCQRDTNEDCVLKCLPAKFFNTIALFLSLNDVMLLLFTLEAIYALTCLGSKSCHAMLQVRGILDQLIALISVEAQSYGPDGFILMRVVETVPSNMLPMVAHIGNLQNVAVIQKPNSHPFASSPTKQQIASSFPLMVPEIVEGPSAPSVVQASQTVENSQSQTQSTQNFTHEDEQYALAWLRATFERTTNTECHIEQQELYRMYLSHCQKSGKHSVVNHVHFPRLVRLIFTNSVGPAIVRKVDGVDLPGLHYIAIRLRAHPLPLQQKATTVPNLQGNKPADNASPTRKVKKKQKTLETITPPTNALCESSLSSIEVVETGQVEFAPLNTNPPTTDDIKCGTETPKNLLQSVEKADDKMEVDETEEKTPNEDVSSDQTPVQVTTTSEIVSNIHGSSQSSQSSQTSLIKSLLANKVSQRQQKQKDITATGAQTTATQATTISHTTQHPIKVPSTAISALVNNPLMQNTSVKVGQTTIKPLNPQMSLEKKQLISESTPPPLAPLSGANVAKDASGRPIIIANQMLVDILDKKFIESSMPTNIIQKRKIDDSHIHSKRVAVDSPTPCSSKHDAPVMPSKNAANLYAEMAASILEDEDLEEFSTQSTNISNQHAITEHQSTQHQHSLIMSSKIQSTNPVPTLQNVQRQLMFQSNQPPQLKLTQTSAGTTTQQIPNAMATIKTDQGLQTVPVILHQKPMDASQTQILQQVIQHSPPPQTQYVLATNQQGQTYLVAQQTQPQPPPPPQQPTQTVLVTQTPQQQSTGAKTIIILQQQPMQGTAAPQQIIGSSSSGQPQKMIMTTSQGQQVLVTQRPQTPQQIFINPQTGAASHLQPRQIIQTSSASGSGQQTAPQLQAGQISPSLLNQLNQIPATIKLHQPIAQSPQSARISMTKGGAVSIVQGAPLQTSQTTPVAIPQLQQHQSIIQQHIISGPSEKRHVILGGGRAIEIKETLITPAQPPLQQSQLNSQTVITTQPPSGATLPLMQQQTQQQVQQQIRAVLEQQQHPSIIQQKISTFSAISNQQTLPQAQPQQIPNVQVPLSTATTTTQTSVFLAAKVPESATQTLKQAKISTATQQTQPQQQQQPSLPAVLLPSGSTNMTAINKSLLPGTPPLIKPSLPIVKLPPSISNAGPPPLSTVNNTAAIASSGPTTLGNQSEKDNNKNTPGSCTQNPLHSAATTGQTSSTLATQASIITSSSISTNSIPTQSTPVQSIQQSTPMSAPSQPQLSAVDAQWLYICDWRNCPRKKFKSLSDLQHHVCTSHAPDHLDPSAEIFCQWGIGPALCDGIPRKRFSLMTHLLDRHLIPDALRAAVQRRITTGMHNIAPSKPPVTIVRNIELSQRANSESPSFSTTSSSSTSQTTTTIGSTALQAIKRRSADFLNSKELMDENEGPVTKSIRLTAALILRNLVIYTTTAKRGIRRFESHLATIAFSNVESSGTIAHILHEMNN